MNARAPRLLVPLLAFLGGSVAFAHDPYEITALARLEPDALVLEVTMARSTALAVATGNREAVPFEPAVFEPLRAGFESCAGKLFTLDSAGTALAPRRAAVSLGVENDVDFRLVYPRPANGSLRLTAAHMEKLGRNYGATLTVQGERGAFLGQQTLTTENPSLEVKVAAAVAVATPPRAASENYVLPIAALVIALVGGGWLWRRQAPG